MLLLLLAIGVGVATGALAIVALQALAPGTPPWIGLIAGVAGMIAALRWILVRYEWIVPWYYLLPAILFLLTFTFFPVILTVILAFTDYAGVRNGQLNIATETAIVEVSGSDLEIADPGVFFCSDLRNGCTDVRARIYASATERVAATSIDGATLELGTAPTVGRDVLAVSMFLPDLGFDFEAPVVAQDGTTLTLERAPPFAPDLEAVTLRLERQAITRTIAADDGARITLTEPLPEGFEATAIARFNDFGFIGWRNFRDIFAQADNALLPVFVWNVLFAVSTVVINTVVGTFLAVLLNNPELRFRALYRTLLILPWALPNIITIQVWKGFLNQNFGAINRLLMLLDITPEPINWLLGGEWAARGAVLLVNLWLGYPFMMVAVLGALSAIPSDLYEAAKIDGASAWDRFWTITAPLLRTALVPITLTGFAFNFNNFNIIFLLTDGGPAVDWGTSVARGTDILISWAYNTAFRSQGGFAYGVGSAISILIFVITLAVSLVNFRVTGALKEESNA